MGDSPAEEDATLADEEETPVLSVAITKGTEDSVVGTGHAKKAQMA